MIGPLLILALAAWALPAIVLALLVFFPVRFRPERADLRLALSLIIFWPFWVTIAAFFEVRDDWRAR